MKNTKKIIISLIICLFIIVAFDFIIFAMRCYKYSDAKLNNKIEFGQDIFRQLGLRPYYTKISQFQGDYNKTIFTDYVAKRANKTPLLIFGCSFAYGLDLDENEKITYFLGKLTNRTVYNRAICGGGLKEFLYQAQLINVYRNYLTLQKINPNIKFKEVIYASGFDNDTTKSLTRIFSDRETKKFLLDNFLPIFETKKFDYLVYVFIDDQIRRIGQDMLDPTEGLFRVRYRLKDNVLALQDTFEEKYKFLHLPYFIREQKIYRAMNKEPEKILNLIAKYLKESKKLIDSTYPEKDKTTMIFVNYKTEKNYFLDNITKEISNDEVKSVEVMDYVPNIREEKYTIDDNWHPSGLVWKEFVPPFVEELNL